MRPSPSALSPPLPLDLGATALTMRSISSQVHLSSSALSRWRSPVALAGAYDKAIIFASSISQAF